MQLDDTIYRKYQETLCFLMVKHGKAKSMAFRFRILPFNSWSMDVQLVQLIQLVGDSTFSDSKVRLYRHDQL